MIKFSTDDDKPVTIVNAPNNWGKTSLYEGIRWCLYDEWPDIKSRGDSTNKEAVDQYTKSHISPEVSVTIDFEHDSENFRIHRSFKYNDKVSIQKKPPSNFYLSSTNDKGTAKKLDNYSDHQLFVNNILPQQVSNYFIVDGDDFRSFTNPTQNETKHAIEQLLNLNIYEKSIEHLSNLNLDLKAEFARMTGQKNATKLAAELEGLINSKKDLEKEFEESKSKKSQAYGIYKEYDKALSKATLSKSSLDKLTSLREQADLLIKAQKKLSTEISDIVTEFYKYKLKNELFVIYKELDQNREKFNIYPYNILLLKDILKSCDDKGHVDCLCGSKIKKDDSIYKNIKEKLKNPDSLSSKDESTVLSVHLDEMNKDLNHNRKSLNSKYAEELKLQQKIEGVYKKISKIEETIDENAARNQSALADNHKQASDLYDKLKIRYGILEDKIHTLNSSIDNCQTELDKVTKTDEKTQKIKMKKDLLEEALAALEKNYDTYRLKKKNQLKKQIQKILFKLFTAEKNFSEFTIDDTYNYDVLNTTGESWKTHLSNGQRKLMSVAFVAGLKNVADEDAPFIIDSPLNAVDKEHQKNYARILPDLSSQLVLFVTDSELTPESYRILKEKAGCEIDINYEMHGDYHRSSISERK